MEKILEHMKPEQIEQVAASTDEKRQFLDKMYELRDQTKGLCILDGLEDILFLLSGDQLDGSGSGEGGSEDLEEGADEEGA